MVLAKQNTTYSVFGCNFLPLIPFLAHIQKLHTIKNATLAAKRTPIWVLLAIRLDVKRVTPRCKRCYALTRVRVYQEIRMSPCAWTHEPMRTDARVHAHGLLCPCAWTH